MLEDLRRKIINWMADVLPNSCPFARDINVFGVYLFSIPPLCKINPFYEDVMVEKFKRLGY